LEARTAVIVRTGLARRTAQSYAGWDDSVAGKIANGKLARK